MSEVTVLWPALEGGGAFELSWSRRFCLERTRRELGGPWHRFAPASPVEAVIAPIQTALTLVVNDPLAVVPACSLATMVDALQAPLALGFRSRAKHQLRDHRRHQNSEEVADGQRQHDHHRDRTGSGILYGLAVAHRGASSIQ